MKRIGCILPLAVLAVLLALAPAARAEQIRLEVGEARVLTMPGVVTRIVMSRDGIVDASMLADNEVQLVGHAQGSTTLTLFTGNSEQGVSHTVTVGESVEARGTVPESRDMVAVEVRFVAMSASTLKQLGIHFGVFGSATQGAITGPSTVSEYSLLPLSLKTALPLANAFNLFLSNTGANVTAVISALSGAGLAQMLAEPTLVARSGHTAEFMAGGEVPIPVPQAGSAAGAITIEYRQYGVKLSISPTVLPDRRIALTVSPEVSEIDTSNVLSIQGYTVPAFRKRSTSTTIELSSGQSFVLAGLLYSSATVSEQKFPWLGDLPVIGALFRSNRNQRERQELVVIATPHILDPRKSSAYRGPPKGWPSAPDPSVADMLLNRTPLDRQLPAYGLLR